MSGKPAVVLNGRTTAITIFGVFAAFVFGAGMCMTMVWDMMLSGIAVGLIGMALLCLMPVCKGLK